jgi:single-stranded DNA-binding protein
MSFNFNSVTFSGNLPKDAQVKVSADGAWLFVTGSLGVKYGEKKKDGSWENKTHWANFKIFAKASQQAEIDRLLKGKEVVLTGSMKTDEYEKDGQKKRFEYVAVDTWKIIDKGEKGEPAQTAVSTQANPDDDIPF